MFIAYIDEGGCLGKLPAADSSIQPVFTLLGVAVPANKLQSLTRRFLQLKRNYFSRRGQNNHSPHYLDWILHEIKGSDLKKDAIDQKRKPRRRALFFIKDLLSILQDHDVKIFGRIYIKEIGRTIEQFAIFTSAVQSLFKSFHVYSKSSDRRGIVILDSRRKNQNRQVSHSIFTQKFSAYGDPYDAILEMPSFGHSENHAGLQIADILVSAIINPIATHVFCTGYINSIHLKTEFFILRQWFVAGLQSLVFRLQDDDGTWKGGIHVNHPFPGRKSSELFSLP